MAKATPRATAANPPTAPVVTSSGLRVPVQIGGRLYTLRPPTFGEAGELAARMVGTVRPGPAMVAETIRQALEAALSPEAAARHCAAITAHEEAEDALQAVLLSRPLDSEPDSARAEWRAAVQAANLALLTADRRRAVAEAQVAEVPEVVRVRSATLEAQLNDRVHSVRVCLVGWEGEGLPPWAPDDAGYIPAEVLRTLPAADLTTLGNRCNELTTPSKVAEKN